MRLILLLFILCIGSKSLSAAIWYVNKTANGAANGTSWANAFTDIASAISASVGGDQIWVAAATYTVHPTSNAVSLSPKSNTSLYGGFLGNETLLSQRNWELNQTIISGDINIIGFSGDNTSRIFDMNNQALLIRIDGFIIKDANAQNGGGAGCYLNNSKLTVANCKFYNNNAFYGAGIYQDGTGILNVENCIFDSHTGWSGLGVYSKYANINITKSKFLNFISSGPQNGGAIYLLGSTSAIPVHKTINQCFFSGTYASRGSCIYADNFNAAIDIYNCLFAGNYSYSGSVVYISQSPFSLATDSLKMVNCTVVENSRDPSVQVQLADAVIHLASPRSLLANSIVWMNGSAKPLDSLLNMTNCITDEAYWGDSTLNYFTNPFFVKPPSTQTMNFPALDSNYRLSVISPGIDNGLNAVNMSTADIWDSARVQGASIDIGCFEHNYCVLPFQLLSSTTTLCDGHPSVFSTNVGNSLLWQNSQYSLSDTFNQSVMLNLICADTITQCRAKLDTFLNYTPAIVTTDTISICPGSSFTMANGNVISNVFVPTLCTSTFTGFNSCDSLVKEQVNLWPQYYQTVYPKVCLGSSFVYVDGTVVANINANQTHISVLNSVHGCDSTIEEVLQLVPIDTTVQILANAIKSNHSQVGSAYQWFNCDSNKVIAGATSSVYTPSADGNYAVIVTYNTCVDTSLCIPFVLSSTNSHNAEASIKVFPNPVNDVLCVSGTAGQNISIATIQGQQLMYIKNLSNKINISLSSLSAGTYHLQCGSKRIKIVKL